MTPTVVPAPGTLTQVPPEFSTVALRCWRATCPLCQRRVEAVTARANPSVLCKCGVRVLIETQEKPT